MPSPAIVRALSGGENGVSDLALLDNANGSQVVEAMEVTVVVNWVLVIRYLSAAESVACSDNTALKPPSPHPPIPTITLGPTSLLLHTSDQSTRCSTVPLY